MLGGSTLTEWLLKTGIVLNDLLIKIRQVFQRCQDGCDSAVEMQRSKSD